ncbi:MAG: DNA polymerase III subunit gamma/tau [Planctomycetota bacterium]|nr:DNA polymerase III subunit gamma/tau [Planctomycetota bacterium]
MAESAPSAPYRVLARKYRPRTFADVIGQEHVVRALSRAMERGRVGQAYLLVGPRGVGKTSTARILAKSMNCERGPTAEPCLECAICHDIERGGDLDVIEIDGASNNGVEDVRNLRDAVATRPLRDRRKVWIVDEVQRLSGPAFDALLKTLEEPPDHAIFVFATTDPHKIPDTIVSRCQVLEFRRLREEDVRTKLTMVCTREGVDVSPEVIAALARGCRGGLRDAESMLDQAISSADGRVTLDDLEMVAGLARPERWLDLFEAVAEDRPADVLRAISEFLARGGTERDLVEQGSESLRDLLHVALLGEDALGVEPEPARRDRMRALAKQLGRDRLEAILGMLFELEGRLQRSPLAARALLEWTLLRAARLGAFLDLGVLVQALQGGASTAPPAPQVRATPSVAPIPSQVAEAPAPAAIAPPPAAPAPPAAPVVASSFEGLLEALTRRRPALAEAIRRNVIHGEIGEQGVLVELRELPPRERVMLDDPAERAALAKLPGSPGPWEFRITSTARATDDLGQKLLESFGGREEEP